MTVGQCYIRGDFYVCPNPLSYDPYNMCEKGIDCSFCFIKQLEAGWLHKKTLQGLKPYPLEPLENQLHRAIDKSNSTTDPAVKALRSKLPVIIGRKSEPFCPSELEYRNTFNALKIFQNFGVTAIPETRMVKGVFETVAKTETKGVSLSIPFGNSTVHDFLDPKTPSYEDRFYLAKQLKASGIYVGLITEPLVPTVNDKEIFYQDYASQAAEANVDHINFGELKISSPRIASALFKAKGLDLLTILHHSNFANEGQKIKQIFNSYHLKSSSPDWVNFHSSNSCYGCCGLDQFGTHQFTFQQALIELNKKSSITLEEMASFNLFGQGEAAKFAKIWNNPKQYFTPASIMNVLCKQDDKHNLVYYTNRLQKEHKPFGDWFA